MGGRLASCKGYAFRKYFWNFSSNFYLNQNVEFGKMNTCMFVKKSILLTFFSGCLGLLAAGCADREVQYVPAYQAPPPGYQGQPAYGYQQAPPAPGDTNANYAPQAPDNGAAVVTQEPPPPQVEVIPAPPAPEYVWAPGYWSWNVGGWVWVRGHYVIGPHPHALWVNGHWARRGHGYFWVNGHWR